MVKLDGSFLSFGQFLGVQIQGETGTNETSARLFPTKWVAC